MIHEYAATTGAALPDDAPAITDLPAGDYTLIRLDALTESATNPRRSVNESGLAELADSIAHVGVLQPVLVRPVTGQQLDALTTHEVICGHRRTRAARLAGLDAVPCVVREMSDQAVRVAQLTENLQREGVHPVEEGEAIAALIAAGARADDIARDLGKSRAYVYARAKLAALHSQVREAATELGLPIDLALAIARLPQALQPKALDRCRDISGSDTWASVRYALGRVREMCVTLVGAPWDWSDATLAPQAGACSSCPKLSDNSPDLNDLGDVVCTDRSCFEVKALATRVNRIQLAHDTGMPVHDVDSTLGYLTESEANFRLGAVPPCLRPTMGLVVPPTGMPFVGVPRTAVDAAILAATAAAAPASTPSTAARAPAGEADTPLAPAAPARGEGARREAEAQRLTPLEQAMLTDEALLARVRVAMAQAVMTRPRDLADLRRLAHNCAEINDWAPYIDVLAVIDPTLTADTSDLDDDIVTRIDTSWSPDQLSAMLLMAALCDDLRRSWTMQGDKAAERIALCAAYGVDVAALAGVYQSDDAGPPAGGAPAQAAALNGDLFDGGGQADQSDNGASAPPVLAPAWPHAALTHPVKYRCPATGQTWSGRGLKPQWLVAAIEAGARLADFEAHPQEASHG